MPPERTFDGYIRVSRRMGRKGEGYISPTIQREAIQRWATYRNITIAEWHIDEDQSGGTQQRPGLRRAMARIQTGETNGIACWRLNRFARNVAAAIEDVEQIQAWGGELAFVEEDIDPTGPFGSFILTILLAVATLERDNLVASWETAKQMAVKRGATIGPTPYGYVRGPAGRLEIDPDQAGHVVEAFRLAATSGLPAARDMLARDAPGRTWTVSTVRRMLGSVTYLGESRYGEWSQPDAHPPLVARAMWEAAQRGPVKRGKAAVYPLSGLARCGTCGGPMVGGRAGQNVRTYRCAATLTTHRGERCRPAAHILADRLEDHVRQIVRMSLGDLVARVGEPDSTDLALAEIALLDAEAELDAFAADMTLRRVLGARYHEHLEARVDAVAGEREKYRELARRAQPSLDVSLDDVLDPGQPKEMGEFLRSILGAIVVLPGRGDVEGRVSLAPHDVDGPAGVLASDDG